MNAKTKTRKVRGLPVFCMLTVLEANSPVAELLVMVRAAVSEPTNSGST